MEDNIIAMLAAVGVVTIVTILFEAIKKLYRWLNR